MIEIDDFKLCNLKPNGRTYKFKEFPESVRDIEFSLAFDVSIDEWASSDIFYADVKTGVFSDKHKLTCSCGDVCKVFHFDHFKPDTLKEKLTQFVQRCESNNWEVTVKQLRQKLTWEYELDPQYDVPPA